MKHHKRTSGYDIAKAAQKLWKKLEPELWDKKQPKKEKIPIPTLDYKALREYKYREENHIKVKWK
jgi:hypothetical protein